MAGYLFRSFLIKQSIFIKLGQIAKNKMKISGHFVEDKSEQFDSDTEYCRWKMSDVNVNNINKAQT